MIAVIGGGLAGCAAAVRLAQAGQRVVLIERSRYLGGRAGTPGCGPKASGDRPPRRRSFKPLDTGQHVFLRCCSAYLRFLQDVGALQHVRIQPRLRVAVYDGSKPGSPPALLASSPLPAPLHMAPSVLRYPFLTWTERLGLARVLAAALRERRDREALWGTTFAAWLQQHGQSERAIKHFWDLVIVPTLNAPSRHVAAAAGLMVLQEALLRDAHGADIGMARVPLSRLLDGVEPLLARHGGRVLLGCPARSVTPTGEGVLVGLAGRPPLEAKAAVLAVYAKDLPRLLPRPLAGNEFFRPALGLQEAPIVDLHFLLDRPLVPRGFDFATFLHSEVQWLFHQHTGPEGQHVSITLSDAHRYMAMPDGQLQARFARELARLFPFSGARPLAFATTRQRRATFLPAPGSQRHRLPQRTPIPRLYLAGDWTDCGWPATMEGAVRSGNLAAAALLEDLHGAP